ncbi:tetratricopeptide repeat protein [Gordonia amicalis]|uniref:tetratricopeptide repeat protein n=1 Tax=Gordonia amicalis TaxID=89053 RepID=UPI0002A63B87|nr:tetratricopeptide repeat protein [Gordonia amicalis]MBA5845842.1 tetratricopeptide repeat protein [Gordonia amicalis]MDV7173083.1 tetratricopeptide repeat protein [Gordonia amicalis]UKO94068.1 tetratricopeptide repeat protein [Gordonia amicalis]UOG23363.1 tetratricopeptide repeat protein [Gordonia amicalis]GAC54813.1 putative thioredoxin [Gordonia amicalis NBRC 100051 = JCM 11271]
MAMTGAVDLGGIKDRAEAQRAQAQRAQAQRDPAQSDRSDGAQPGTPPPGAPPVASGASVIDVTEETFEAEVLNRSMQQLVVVDLWAEWCGPCKQLSPVLERLAAQSGGRWVLAKVDVDANPRIAQAFRVQSIPMVVAIVQGQPVTAFNGVRSEAEITSWIDEIFAQVGNALPDAPAGAAAPEPEQSDPRMIAAEEKLNDGDFDGALAAYRAVAEAEPENVEAASAARNLEFILRAQAHDPNIVETASPRDVDAQLAAADVLLLSQQPEAAFDRIIDVVRVTNGEERTRARTRLLELFELFDPAEPFVVTARRKLASALY